MEEIQDYKIKTATYDEGLAVVDLMEEFINEAGGHVFDKNDSILSVKEFIDAYDKIILVLMKEDKVVGFLAGVVSKTLFGPEYYASELGWFVSKDYRGYHQSVKLIEYFEEWSKKMGAKKVLMTTIKHLKSKSIDTIYKRKGFKLLEMTYYKEL